MTSDYILDKSKVQKDLEEWAKKLKKADELLREVYKMMNEIYMANQYDETNTSKD